MELKDLLRAVAQRPRRRGVRLPVPGCESPSHSLLLALPRESVPHPSLEHAHGPEPERDLLQAVPDRFRAGSDRQDRAARDHSEHHDPGEPLESSIASFGAYQLPLGRAPRAHRHESSNSLREAVWACWTRLRAGPAVSSCFRPCQLCARNRQPCQGGEERISVDDGCAGCSRTTSRPSAVTMSTSTNPAVLRHVHLVRPELAGDVRDRQWP